MPAAAAAPQQRISSASAAASAGVNVEALSLPHSLARSPRAPRHVSPVRLAPCIGSQRCELHRSSGSSGSSTGVDAVADDGPDVSLRLLLVQRVDCLSARAYHLEQQLRLANATVFTLAEGHVRKDQRIAELEERLERRRMACGQPS